MALKNYRIGLFDRLNGDSFGLSDDDKDRATRQGLLGLAAGLLGTGGGFGNALGAGIQSGLLAMNQGADNVVNDRYRQAMMQRTMQGAERNARAEELAKRFYGPDGKPDMAVARELASIDAPMAKSLLEFGQPEQDKWTPYDITDPNNPNNVISAMHNGRGQWQYPDGTPLFNEGPLAGAAQSTPQLGIMQAVEQVESGGNPYAVSPKGAIGPMQTMPGTLMDPGFGVIPARDNSVEEQRRVGQDYLEALTEKYGVTGGLAAYNWGPGNWDRALASNNNDVSAALSGAPAETRAYVPKVMDRMRDGATPTSAASRFSRPRYKPENQQARAPTELERRIELARNMGATEDEIKRLVLGNAAPNTRDALGGKPLTQGTINGMVEDSSRLENLSQMGASFQDSYAGNKFGGAAENLAGRLGLPGATPGQAEWWQGYDRIKNEIRNKLFGASLTESEKRAFEASDITPDMSPSVIKANLAKQEQIIKQALERKAKAWAAQGYNRGSIIQASGVDVSEGDGSPQAGDIQDGYRFRGGDPADPMSWEKVR